MKKKKNRHTHITSFHRPEPFSTKAVRWYYYFFSLSSVGIGLRLWWYGWHLTKSNVAAVIIRRRGRWQRQWWRWRRREMERKRIIICGERKRWKDENENYTLVCRKYWINCQQTLPLTAATVAVIHRIHHHHHTAVVVATPSKSNEKTRERVHCVCVSARLNWKYLLFIIHRWCWRWRRRKYESIW